MRGVDVLGLAGLVLDAPVSFLARWGRGEGGSDEG